MNGSCGFEAGHCIGGHGIGGIFFKAKDPKKLKAWYQTHLGLPYTEHPDENEGEAVAFRWRENDNPTSQAYTVWSPFPADTKYFEPSQAPFMINYRVENLEKLRKVVSRRAAEGRRASRRQNRRV